MKLNCDMGESFGSWKMGDDGAVMPWIDMANIACGFHASDPDVMAETVLLAKKYGVRIGAHPGYNDKQGFGRRHIPHSLTAISHLIAYQVGALDAICQLQNADIDYVKPHGALYHDMMSDIDIFKSIITTISALNQQRSNPLSLMILAQADNQAYSEIAKAASVPLLFEGFADRAYNEQGQLVARDEPNAVYSDPESIKAQVYLLAQGKVKTQTGQFISMEVDTVCVHGDNPQSIATIKALALMLDPKRTQRNKDV